MLAPALRSVLSAAGLESFWANLNAALLVANTMGVHDYCDFVQRNGQTSRRLDLVEDEEDWDISEDEEDIPDSVGNAKAVLVRVPGGFSRRDILGWPLTKFAEFATTTRGYSWDRWGFEQIEGYQKVLTGETPPEIPGRREFWDYAVWKSESFPGEWLVNFDPAAYDAFVLGEADPEAVPWWYYREVFDGHGRPMPKTKKQAYANIVACGEATLWGYDGRELEPLKIPARFLELRRQLWKLPVFSESHEYVLHETPPDLSKARLSVLVYDHTVARDLYMVPEPDLGAAHTAPLCLEHRPGGDSRFELRFYPTLRLELPWTTVCLECGGEREAGSYMCPEHLALYGPTLRARREAEIAEEAARLGDELSRSIPIVAPPEKLYTSLGAGREVELVRAKGSDPSPPPVPSSSAAPPVPTEPEPSSVSEENEEDAFWRALGLK